MAPKPKEQRPELTNVEARQACVRDGFAARFAVERQIAALEAEHIKPLKDQKSKDWKNVSADTGFAITDLNDQYRIFKRQELAKSFDEESDRDTVLEAQREIFEALHAGQTLDFLSVLAKVGGNKPKKAKAPAFGTAETPAEEPAAEEPAAAPAEPEGLEDQDPLTSPLLLGKRSLGHAAYNQGHTFDRNPHHQTGTIDEKAWNAGWWTGEGAKAYREGKKVMECRHSTGTPAWRAWNHGWNGEAKNDGADAESAGKAAATGSD